MNFLAPLFLLGALAVAVPVFFHLIRRSSKEQMPFSSLMFLQPSPPRVTKRSRLEHILLLLLRCLVLCLLALGFSRPFFQQPMTAAQATENSRKIIVLMDTSASMRREGLWAAAVEKADGVLGGAGPGDQVAVFTFDSQPHAFVSFEQWAAMSSGDRASLASGRLAAVQPGWASTHLGNALIAAAEAFADADKQGQNVGQRRIVVITDLQEGSRLDGLQGYDWPRGIEVQVETIAPKKPTNAGLQWIQEANDSGTSETNNAIRIRVSNSSNAKREQFQLRWEGVAGVAPLEVYVPPGQNRVVAAPALPTNATGERLVLTGDDYDFDNRVFLIPPRAENINVLFVGDEAEEPAQPLYYLKRAFQQTRRQAIEIRTNAAAMPLPPALLADTRLLIATDRLPDAQLQTLGTFMNEGGTVLFVLKNTAGIASAGRLAGADTLTAEETTAANYAMLGTIDFGHPLFASFSDPRYNDFTKIHFWKYRKLDAAKIPNARVLAKFDSGDPALIELSRGKGRLLILTSGWQPVDSQLALSSKFVPLLYAMLDQAGGIRGPVTQFHIGDEVNLADLASFPAGQAITVRKPDGSDVQLPAGMTKWAQTETPGIYSVTPAAVPVRFAVNLDAAESRTAVLPADDLERLGVPMKAREISQSQQLEQKRKLHDSELESQQKLWRWLTFAALMVLLGETWAAGRLTRRPALQPEAST